MVLPVTEVAGVARVALMFDVDAVSVESSFVAMVAGERVVLY